MTAKGLRVSPAGIAQHYRDWLDILVIHRQDASQTAEVERLGIRPVLADTLMTDRTKEIALARQLLEVAGK
jgi:hypothetical protein